MLQNTHTVCPSVGHIDLALESPLVAQLLESVQRLGERDQLAHFLGGRVVAVADVDGARLLFFGADHCSTCLLVSFRTVESNMVGTRREKEVLSAEGKREGKNKTHRR